MQKNLNSGEIMKFKLSFNQKSRQINPKCSNKSVKFGNFSVYISQGPQAHIKRAPTEKLREVFLKYASHEKNGERFMTAEDFIRGYLRLFPEQNYNKVTINLILK